MVKTKKILLIGLLGVTLAIGTTGCGAPPTPPKQMNASKIDAINIEYQFNDELQDNQISKQKLINAIKHQMSNSSGYSKEVIQNNPTGHTYGHVIEYNNNIITVNYLRGNQNCGNDCKSKYGQVTQVIFDIKLNVKEKSKNNFLVSASFPQQYTIKPDSNLFGTEFDPLDDPNKLELDAKKMFNSLKNKPIIIHKSIKFKGELNTKYPDKAVYANFKRMLGEFVNWNYWSSTTNEKISESEKQNSFILKVNNKSYPLYIEVYPYRNGSKVVYSTTLKYTINSKGNSTLHAKDIFKLRKKIESIVNN